MRRVMALVLCAATTVAAADVPVRAENETRPFLQLERVVDLDHCDVPPDAPEWGLRRVVPGRHAFPHTSYRKLEWLGGAMAMGIDPPTATLFKDPAAPVDPKNMAGEWIHPGDRIGSEGRLVTAFLGDAVVLEGEGENCWRSRHLPPARWPAHWQTCPALRNAPSDPSGRHVAADVDCAGLALAAVSTARLIEGGQVKTTTRSAALVDRAGRTYAVNPGDRVCRAGLVIVDIQATVVVTAADRQGRNCYRAE
jgi:hypothetical protein